VLGVSAFETALIYGAIVDGATSLGAVGFVGIPAVAFVAAFVICTIV